MRGGRGDLAGGGDPGARGLPAGGGGEPSWFPLPEPVTLPAVLARTAAARPGGEALVVPPERVRWAELRAGARDVAAALSALGVRPGDHVGVLLGNSADWVRTFYACAWLGAVTVPVSTRFRLDELRYCLAQARISTLVFAERFLDIDFAALLAEVEPALAAPERGLPGTALPALQRAVVVEQRSPEAARDRRLPALPRLGDLVGAVDDDARARVDGLAAAVRPEQLLLIQYTSGTTAFPKGVMLTHRNMLQDAAAVAARMGVLPDDRYFSIRPFYHVAGTTLSLLVSLVSGACLLTLPRFDVPASLRLLDEERCTLTSGNDTIFLTLMGHPDFDPARLHLRGGWAAAGPEVMQRIHDQMRVPGLCAAYGLSEASPNVVMSSWRDPLALRVAGRALPHEGTEVRTVDPASGRLQPPGAPGEIQVRGWNVMKGYFDLPERTAEAFTPDGWLRTGDLGELGEDGRLRMIGRLKDVFRVGGENVAPAEVEETLHAHPAVKMAQVVGVPDARLGEVAAAYVVLREGWSLTSDELIAWCRGRCANYKVPRYLRVVESFDHVGLTGSSKVPKARLREVAIRELGLG